MDEDCRTNLLRASMRQQRDFVGFGDFEDVRKRQQNVNKAAMARLRDLKNGNMPPLNMSRFAFCKWCGNGNVSEAKKCTRCQKKP